LSIHRFEVPEPSVAPGEVGSYVDGLAFDDATCRSLAGIVEEARRLFDTPVAVVSLDRDERIGFACAIGLDSETTIPRRLSMCGHALHQAAPFVVLDAASDDRFAGNPLVFDGPGLRTYVGAQLRSAEGLPYGMLCVQDSQPRHGVTAAHLAELVELAARASAVLEASRDPS
jgi:GAF domain-containing protein